MQTITNEAYLRRRARLVWLLSVGGIAVMIAGAIRYYRGGGSVITPVALIVGGLVIGNIGLFLGRRWLRRPRPDEVLRDALGELGRQYRLYNYTPPAPHLLISPVGVYVLTVQRQYGRIVYNGKRWRRSRHWQQSILEMNFDRLGNPGQRAAKEVERVREFIARELPGQEVPVQAIIVFTHPRAEVEPAHTPMLVTHVDDLKTVLREATKEKSAGLRRRQRQQLEQILDSLAGQSRPAGSRAAKIRS